MSPADHSRRELLSRVIDKCAAESYTELAPKENFNPQPLLYFGDPCTAEFATFGMNPSAEELNLNRWPLEPMLTLDELDYRLVNYFKNVEHPPNDWFDGYEARSSLEGNRALDILGHSYRSDTVHLDFSPRATTPRSTMARRLKKNEISRDEYSRFVDDLRKLIASDLCHFVSTLALCRNLRAAIMAGAIANDARRDYLYQVLQAHFPQPYALKLRCLLEQPDYGAKKPRDGATALYDLVGPHMSIPVLFISKSPSSGDRGATLADEVRRNLNVLRAAGF